MRPTSHRASEEAPPLSTHVISQALRLLANDAVLDKTKVRYSDTSIGTTDYTGLEQWLPGADNTSGFFTGESRPDPVVALAENANNVFAIGSASVDVFNSDPTYVFARVNAFNYGCGAPYSVVKREDTLYWVDQFHRILKVNDGGASVISQNIQATLDAVDISDGWAFRARVGPLDALVFVFPTDGRAFAYQDGIGWSQWSGYNGATPRPIIISCFAQQSLVGTTTGYIGELSLSANDDLGSPIQAYIETGYENHNTDAIKESIRVLLTLKRGQTSSSTAPMAWLKWRDRPGPWEEPLPIDLGITGDTEVVVEFTGLGTYRRRQWCFEFAGGEELALVAAVEEFNVTE